MKKAIKRIVIILIVIVALPFLAYGLLLLTTPISRSDESVRDYVFRQIPAGTSWEDAIAIIEEEEWEIEEISTDSGLRINDVAGNVSFATSEEMLYGVKDSETTRIVGTQAMYVRLGEYYGPFHEAVFAYLAFDENGELVEVAIRRDIDAL